MIHETTTTIQEQARKDIAINFLDETIDNLNTLGIKDNAYIDTIKAALERTMTLLETYDEVILVGLLRGNRG